MRLRTYLGLLLALALLAVALLLARMQPELLTGVVPIGGGLAMSPAALVVVSALVGFLPPATILLVHTLRRDLGSRRARRAEREAAGLDAASRRAHDLRADGQWAKAAAELEVLLAGRSDDYDGLLRLGEILRHLGRGEEAIAAHRRAAALHPHSVALLYELAADHEAAGEAGVAREIEGRILREFPGFGLAVHRRRRAEALAAGSFEEAAGHQARIVELLGESGDRAAVEREQAIGNGLEYQRGVARLELEETVEAVAIFDAVLAREPRFVPALIMRGEAEHLAGRSEAALAEWRRGYEATGSPVFLQRIEDHCIEIERPELAIETLRALATPPRDLLPRFFLGRLYYRLELRDEALKVLSPLAERLAGSPTYQFLMARLHERRGETASALAAYRSCLRQLDLASAEFLCGACGTRTPDWRDRCGRCGSWNSVELDIAEEQLAPADVGLRERPIWGPLDPDRRPGDAVREA
jgi:tetratricopeptide (TPR) repeat protein